MKHIFRGMSLRLLVAPALVAGLCVITGTLFFLSFMIDMSLRRVADLNPQLGPLFQQQCERDPEEFQRSIGSDLNVYFYDADTLKPRTPTTPPVDTKLLRRWRAGEAAPGRMMYLEAEGGRILRRSAPAGPCSLMEIHWRLSPSERPRMLVAIAGLVIMSVLVAVATAVFFALRPLLRRIERLRRATENLGQSTGYASAADPEPDDLGHLSTVLDQAHARIAADAARAAERQKALEEHLANVAHDLRTPLASLQLTIEHLAGEAQRHQQGLVRGAIDDIVYMGSLIENLYLACRLEEGADPLSGDPRVDLCRLVDGVTRRFSMLGRVRNIEVHGAHPDGEVWVRCNSAMAGQVLANLVHNAVAHGQPHGNVGVVLETTDEAFTLTVLDDGPGVAPTEIPRIGERTFRSDQARQRDPAGGGLGLAIVGEVCRRAGFTLGLESEQPRGLRVTVQGRRLH